MRIIIVLMSVAFSQAQPINGTEWSCPSWLAPVCDSTCIMTHCFSELKGCISDPECRASFQNTANCQMKMNKSDPEFPYACLVPDNLVADKFFNCAMEKHKCMSPGVAPVYPSCNESITGDASFSPNNLAGVWYKNNGWLKGEGIECMPCQVADFSISAPDNTVTFQSNWTSYDWHKKLWPMSVTAHMSPTGPGTLFNTGQTFGLTYWEPYTVVAGMKQPSFIDSRMLLQTAATKRSHLCSFTCVVCCRLHWLLLG